MVNGVYRRSVDFARDFLPCWGIETTFVPIDDLEALAAAIRPSTRLIFAETPTNPYLRVMDLARVVEIARRPIHVRGAGPRCWQRRDESRMRTVRRQRAYSAKKWMAVSIPR